MFIKLPSGTYLNTDLVILFVVNPYGRDSDEVRLLLTGKPTMYSEERGTEYDYEFRDEDGKFLREWLESAC